MASHTVAEDETVSAAGTPEILATPGVTANSGALNARRESWFCNNRTITSHITDPPQIPGTPSAETNGKNCETIAPPAGQTAPRRMMTLAEESGIFSNAPPQIPATPPVDTHGENCEKLAPTEGQTASRRMTLAQESGEFLNNPKASGALPSEAEDFGSFQNVQRALA
eukprot:CAMPEP_0194488542 /NCGR_PEP_ID=MMETSP0253-20130528/8428_1 /TAXON_ID=2966 /ORGANISM="Noctiluca scintillans" /LENGTH=167 /DNA_ID=CAMNT_0039328921 /DNA_START=54 /DNA_END=554 /DNA_ORIENTATION=+